MLHMKFICFDNSFTLSWVIKKRAELFGAAEELFGAAEDVGVVALLHTTKVLMELYKCNI